MRHPMIDRTVVAHARNSSSSPLFNLLCFDVIANYNNDLFQVGLEEP